MPVDVPRPTAVTFDFWDTLVVARMSHMRDRRTDGLLGLIDGAGFAVHREAVERSVVNAYDTFKRSWAANEQFDASDAIDHVLRELGVQVSAAMRDEMVDIIRAGDPECELTPNVASTLRTLKDSGVRLGIICDVGWSPSTLLRGHLERHGVLEFFDHWSFSDEVGHYKPSREAFAHAHAGLGVEDPALAAHVGDLRRTDIRGARASGCTAIRYAGIFDDQSDGQDGDLVIHDHADLPGALGITDHVVR